MPNPARPLCLWGGLLALLALGAVSCSGGTSLNPVAGKVLHKDQPLSGALVTLHPKGATDHTAVPATGLTKDDGTFTVTTGNQDGAPAGEYVVTVVCSRMPKNAKKGLGTGNIDTEDVLQGAYANRDTSKIFVTLKAGPNQLETFNLK